MTDSLRNKVRTDSFNLHPHYHHLSSANQELLQENAVLKNRIIELELSEATLKRIEATLRHKEHYLKGTSVQDSF
ncbi:MAG: hypothetical protein CSYNP_03760 [Syntrophus sp. SKADARSKE-3]|nr:hypothetical protein [Syntrophus sp. SKADARSKE-3]